MSDPFGPGYAAIYDALYADKDYDAECGLIGRLLARHQGEGGLSLLDLGCGTGGHAFPLARRGHAVVGVDRSAAMLEQARCKTDGIALPVGVQAPAFHLADLRDLDLGRRFDAVLMMFAVLGYQHGNDDLMAALRTVRRHLQPGGLFLFDVWHGPAVLTDRPGPRLRTVPMGAGQIARSTESRLDPMRHLCHVHFAWRQTEGNRVLAERAEEHVMRFFFPQELDLALGIAGLRLLELLRLPDGDVPAGERDWTVIGVARAV